MKKIELIPFVGAVEYDDDEPQEIDRNLYFRTQQEVADELGITRNAVGDTEKRAIRKVRAILIKRFKKSDLI